MSWKVLNIWHTEIIRSIHVKLIKFLISEWLIIIYEFAKHISNSSDRFIPAVERTKLIYIYIYIRGMEF